MNPLPVSLDFTSNSTSKPSAKTSASNDVDAEKFKKELSKQENSSLGKEVSGLRANDKATQQNEPTESTEAAKVASDGTVSGEELPPNTQGNEQEACVQHVDAQDINNVEELPEPTSLTELGITVNQTVIDGTQIPVEVIDRIEELAAFDDTLGLAMALDGEEGSLGVSSEELVASDNTLALAMALEGEGEGESLRSLSVQGEVQLPYSPPGLAGSLNAGAINGTQTVSEDALLEQPLEKLMTLEQMKQSLEKGIETLAELEVDVDTDSEGTIREVFRFNDLQLKESQSSLKTYTTSVELPVSPGAWADKVNDKIVWLANQKIQFAEIHLNPQDLGPMEVKINVQNDQATVTFNSQHQGVRELLEMNVNRLREMMSENGVDLAHVDVSDQSSQHHANDEEEGGVAAQSGDGEDELSSLGEAESITDAITLNNLVDYYA